MLPAADSWGFMSLEVCKKPGGGCLCVRNNIYFFKEMGTVCRISDLDGEGDGRTRGRADEVVDSGTELGPERSFHSQSAVFVETPWVAGFKPGERRCRFAQLMADMWN